MSSGLLSIARTALTTHQTALQTIAHNIANAETPGYSRQEVVLEANTPVRLSYGNTGTGVSVTTIIRKRDILLDDGFRSSNASLGTAEGRRDGLSSLEGIFGEPSEAGMSATLDAFWGAWSDLATSPNSGAARAVVQQRGAQVADLFNSYDAALTDQRSAAVERLSTTVDHINGLASQVAHLNGRIVSAETGGHSANDLRDERDNILDSLSRIAGTRVFAQNNGSTTVVIGNSNLVDGSSSTPLHLEFVSPVPPPAVTPSDIPVRIRLGTSPDTLAPLGGELKSVMEFANSDVPVLRSRLDTMASSLVTAVNSAHSAGFTFDGNTIPGTAAGDFFDAGTVTDPVRGGTMRLSAAVAADPANVASSSSADAPTDNMTARALTELRTTAGTVSYTGPDGVSETGSFLGFFRTTVTKLGTQTRRAEDDTTIYTMLAEQADVRRQSVSGVSTDEELVQMLRVQQSYTAATKMIKVADEMLQTLLSLI